MIGEAFGNFRIVSRLGRGGMGEVYLAEQQNIGTRVAVKLLHPEISADAEHVQRFFNEARAVSRIQHAGIVKIFDVGFHPSGHAYLVMEFLEGESLGTRIRRTFKMSPAHIADLGRQIASVLDATHSAGITHRDLKPDNIYIVPDRELASRQRAKVLDFGIAKLTGTLAHASPRTMGTMGTPAYMAPEQWGDASKVDWRADIYSLGCLVFEMACGRPPFVVTTLAEACGKHLTEVPVPASALAPDLPPELVELIACMLEKRPDDRPQSMEVVVRRFEAIAAIVGPPPPMVIPAPNVHPAHPSSTPSGRPIADAGLGATVGTQLPGRDAGFGATVGTEFPARDPGFAPTVGTEPPAPRAAGTVPRIAEAAQATRSKGPLWIVALLVVGAGIGAGAYFRRGRKRPPRAPVVTPVAPANAPEPFACDSQISTPTVAGDSGSTVPLRYTANALKESEITTTLRSTWKVDDEAGLQTGDMTLTLVSTLDWGPVVGDTFSAELRIKKVSFDNESTVRAPGKDAEVSAIRWRSDDPAAPPQLSTLQSLIGYPVAFRMTTRGQLASEGTPALRDHLRAKGVPDHIIELFSRDEVFRTLFIELPESPVKIDDRWTGGELLRKLPSRGNVAASYDFRVAAVSGNAKQVVIETRPALKLDISGRIKELAPRQTAFEMSTVFDVVRGELTSTQARACARMDIELDGKRVKADAVVHTTTTSRAVDVANRTPPEKAASTPPSPPTPMPDKFSAEEISRVIKANEPALKRCYTARYLQHPEIGDSLTATLQISIAPNGSLSDLYVSGVDETITTCMRTVLDKVTFPAPGTPRITSYPLPLAARKKQTGDDSVEPPPQQLPQKPDAGKVTQILTQQNSRVATCGIHQRDLKSVSVRVEIAPDGSVASVAAAATAAIKMCVEPMLKSMRFPPSVTGDVVTKTYALTSPRRSGD